MPSYDFSVDLQALVTAAQSTAETVQAMKDNDVEDFVPTESSCGSDEVWSAVDEFKDRWERGVNDLCNDVAEVSGRLGKVAMTYAEFDQAGAEQLSAIQEGLSVTFPQGGG